MQTRRMPRLRSLCSAALVSLAVAATGAQAQGTVVMSGLDNPRGLAFGPEGALYVTEAGRGAYEVVLGAPPICQVSGTGETRCYGPTGAVSRLWKGKQERVLSGLPSHAQPNGTTAAGPNDISFQGRGGAYITIGLGGDAAFRNNFGQPLFDSVIRLLPSGNWEKVADVLPLEEDHNPDGGAIDSNAYGLLATAGERVLTDAGGNSLIRIAANGAMSIVAAFPPAPLSGAQSVPTSVALGPDGAYYVGELTGFPFRQGAARVHRVIPGASSVYLTGFSLIIDLTFDAEGRLYVLQHSSGSVVPPGPGFNPFPLNSGSVIRVEPNGTRTTIVSGLNRPTAMTLGPDGALYVTNNGILPFAGEVRRVELP